MRKRSTTKTWTFTSSPQGERFLPTINHDTFLKADSKTLYQKHFNTVTTEENQLNIIIGTDSGLFVQHVSSMSRPSGSRFLFIELDELIAPLTKEGLFKKLPHDIKITNVTDLPKHAEKFHINDYLHMDAVRIFDSFCVSSSKEYNYQHLSSLVRQHINAQAYDVIMKLGNRNYTHTQIMNLSENRIPGNLLTRCREQFSGKTAVILGGGPSLDSFLPWISEKREEIAIFAISRITRRLTTAGIKPHFIVSIDRAKYNLHISKEMLLLDDEPILINANHVNHQLLSSWKNSSIYLGSRFPWDAPLNSDKLSPWGPTVTNTALGAAVEMGFNTIILIGVDLCYSPTGATHASESYEYENGPKLDATITVTTNSGDTAETSSDYYGAIKYLSEQALEAQNRGVQIISPCPGAVRIKKCHPSPT